VRLHYISPSLLPSRSANAVHVTLQCDALARAGCEITLYAKRSVPDAAALGPALRDAYGVDAGAWRLVSYYSRIDRADNVRIAALALADLRRRARPDAILSRNLYAAFALAVWKRQPLIFETHQLERGPRKVMQRAVMTRPWVTTVLISNALVGHLTSHHGVPPARPVVLHDAAPAGLERTARADRWERLAAFGVSPSRGWTAVCAYFGQLYAGRGVEIIEALAAARPTVLFLVFGGNDADIGRRRARNMSGNLRFVGHVPHTTARQAMTAVDVLLMPYQTSVSIGVRGHDTAAWMSPMKMFEYLGSGVPIISSDLPVLREVLTDGRNALLVASADAHAWVSALDRLIEDDQLARQLGAQGHADYLARHTWDARARRLLELAGRLPPSRDGGAV
jgi:hypothetical protein